MKEYKKRFIQLSMLSIGMILSIILIVVYYNIRAEQFTNLELTMREMLEPLSRQDPYILPEGAEKSMFVTVFVGDDGKDDLSVFDLSAEYNEEILSDVINDVLQCTEDFGTLAAHQVIYYRRAISGGYKIAFADEAYLQGIMRRFLLLLLGSWGMAMLIFYGISRAFASFAVYPIEQTRIREAQFVADASHDLKTPLSVIIANNEIILRTPDAVSHDSRKWISSSQEAAYHMQAMIKQMLDLYTADYVGIPLKICRCDLSEIVEKNLMHMEALALERSVQMRSEVEKSVVIFADPSMISHVIDILIDNALKYEPPGGSVFVQVQSDKKGAAFTIHNHTVISPHDLPFVFERFYRGDRERNTEGHGLGLAIAQSLSRKTGGVLHCTSDPERGTVFTLKLKPYRKHIQCLKNKDSNDSA